MRGILGFGVVSGYGAARGLRNSALALALTVLPAAAAETIAALGDSLTQGYGLPDGAGFVPQLEGWLNARGHDVSIVNAGVSGDTSAGGLSRVGWTLTDDVDAVIVELGGNDLLRGLDPATTRANLDGILAAIDAKRLPALVVGISAPGNYGPDYQRAFDAIFPALGKKYGAAVVPDFFAGIDDGPDRAANMQRYMQADGIHPNAAGVKIVVERIGPAVEALLARVDG